MRRVMMSFNCRTLIYELVLTCFKVVNNLVLTAY